MSIKLNRDYPHMPFVKKWEISNSGWLLLGQCEAFVRAIENTPILPIYYDQLMRVSLLKGAQSTTAIEGNTLTDDEVLEVLEGNRLPPSKEYQQIEVANVVNALNELLSELLEFRVDNYISPELLKRFHKMIGRDLGENFAAIPGQLRSNDVIVGHYRCTDYNDVPALLDNLCDWMKREFAFGKSNQQFHGVLIQAIVCHVYIEWIHPFSDGNGRTGRLAEFYIMLRGGNPDIASHILSNYYNQTRQLYYRHLDEASVTGDLSEFIEYALLGFRDGLVQKLLEIQKSQFENTWQRHIYDTFDNIKDVIRNDSFRRQRKQNWRS